MPQFSNWRQEYQNKTVSAEEAVQVIKSGDRVAFAVGAEPLSLGLALMARKEELRDVKLLIPAPGRDFAWYDAGWEDPFQIELCFVLPAIKEMMAERRGDFVVIDMTNQRGDIWAEPNVAIVQLSAPDDHGFCSFGASLWDKKELVNSSKKVLAEVNPNFIRTYGENYIHISEIDLFVEGLPTGELPGAADLLGRKTSGPTDTEKSIAEFMSELVKDGDCLEIGVGSTAEYIARSGALNGKHDLGWHSENTPRGIATLVREGIINGRKKKLNTGKAVATAVGGGTKEEMDYINMNALFEVYRSHYVLNPAVIATNSNVTAINSAIAVDLTGQIAAESVGSMMVSGPGGQLAFATGASISKGGRFVTVLPSTAKQNTASRIVSRLEPSTIVTIPRNLSDIVVTEYGVATLKGKSQRRRAEELIAITHPDFRVELRKEAKKLFWP